jgi:hypothetical protein
MHAADNKYIDKLITPLLLVAGTILALSSFSTAAYAVSLDELYTTMMTIRGCGTVVSGED